MAEGLTGDGKCERRTAGKIKAETASPLFNVGVLRNGIHDLSLKSCCAISFVHRLNSPEWEQSVVKPAQAL